MKQLGMAGALAAALAGAVSPAHAEEDALAALAARCGSELDWAEDWEQAAAKARREDKLVLVYLRDQRGFSLSDEQMIGPFMDEDVVAWARARCVALRFERFEDDAPFEDPQRYGLGPLTFGVAVLIATPAGEIVAETCLPTTEGVQAVLLAGLRAAPRPPEPKGDALARARVWLERGELDRAEAALGRTPGAPANLLRARLARCRWNGEQALAALADAAAAGAALADVGVERALVLLRSDDAVGARAAAEEALAAMDGLAHPLEPKALFLAGAAAFAAGATAPGTQHWNRILTEHSASRWAWQVAGISKSTLVALGGVPRFAWPQEDVRRALVRSPDAPLPARDATRAVADAAAYLARAQRANGSWLCGGEVDGSSARASDLTLGASAIAARALLHQPGAAAAGAVERALAWFRAQRELEVADSAPPLYMDYGGWSAGFRLWFAADCVALGRMAAADPFPAGMIAELAERQKPGGGWHYYVSGEATGAPSDGSTSFITAAAVLALIRAREVGIEVPEDVLDRALGALDRMRNANGSYEYWIDMGTPRQHAIRRDGAYGRGPMCALARLRGGRGTLGEVRTALAEFVQHRAALERERGKSLMHAGPAGEGVHYVLFDFAGAAAALAALPPGERAEYREPLAESILAMRTEDGAFLDFALIGADYGAGMALLALRDLARK